MAGIYIHIPFCKSRCNYCDFFTKTDIKQKQPYVSALCREIELSTDYFDGEIVNTIYFGGGTPSQLTVNEISSILSNLRKHFAIANDAEVTLEANPDDLSENYLSSLINLGFNRLSMGVQSFDDGHLKFLNRRHSAQKVIDSVKISQSVGFKNISIDLIYGIPNQSSSDWIDSLDKTIDLGIQHVSSYHLIYEKGTKLYRLLKKGEVRAVEEDLSLDLFSLMIDKLSENGFTHYEISNFAKDGYISKHNSSYWLNESYLGLGPSAHSYNKIHRSWNVSSIPKYINAIESGNRDLEIEELSDNSRYNDFVLTSMRTMWGAKREDIEMRFGTAMLLYFDKNIKKHIDQQTVKFENNTYSLTREGIFISDSIMSDLMYL